ncbi:MAG: potassium channel protein [Candidatus Bathyarchaeota archaeon]|nr:MAG: potassium channel protein [Candidatus Bathyarchaeota archaeon]
MEKVEYRPISVRDLLVEIKDLSELMIDLAYSAALFNSKELAEEVLALENHVDTLAYLLHMNVMIAVRDAEDAEHLVAVSTVASAADKISNAAADIATIVIQNIGIHPIVRQVFEKVEERLIRVKVRPNSILAEASIGELELAAKIGVNVIAIRRNGKWIIGPKGNERLERDDVLLARGAPHGIDELRAAAEGSLRNLED